MSESQDRDTRSLDVERIARGIARWHNVDPDALVFPHYEAPAKLAEHVWRAPDTPVPYWTHHKPLGEWLYAELSARPLGSAPDEDFPDVTDGAGTAAHEPSLSSFAFDPLGLFAEPEQPPSADDAWKERAGLK